MFTIRRAAVGLTLALTIAACGGGSSFDRDDAVSDFVDSGLTQDQAECVVDAMVDEFGEELLASDAEPTEAQQDAMIDLTTDCVLGGGVGSGGDSSDGGDASSDAGGEQVASELFSDTDLAPACRGNGVAGASPYTPGDGTNLTVVLEGADPDYGFSAVVLPDGWESDFETIGDTELVTCLNRISATPTEVCDGYEDEGLEWSVQLHDSTYEVSIREATTGTVLATGTYDAPADGCPMFSSYFEGDPNPKPDYETPDAEIEVLLAEFVTGAAPATVPPADDAPADTEAPADTQAPAGGDASEPFTYGDDAELDVLWDACAGGDFASCDELFFVTPIGSEYEEFGATCGFRNEGQNVGNCISLG
ncbi:MAG: hypothetical protein AAGD18_02200 [Actinomycetota bacterium]